MELGGRSVGPNAPVFLVAELSANHRRDFDVAVRLIQAARDSGADAVKLQTFTPETLTLASHLDHFVIRGGTPWDGRELYDLYSEVAMPWDWQVRLKEVADDLGITLFSTPFDRTAVDFLEAMNVPAYKVSSFEIVDIPLIQYIASKGKPVLISTGLATKEEIQEAVNAAQAVGNDQIALLKCTSSYPAPAEEMNLRAIPDMARAFGLPVGLSDHSLEVAVPVVAVALGACIIEKHLTLSRAVPGPDSGFSLEPQEFKAMVEAVRIAERALGEARYGPSEREMQSVVFRRSLFVVRDVAAGDAFTEENVRSIRPGNGLHPRYLKDILGRRAARSIDRGTPLRWELVRD